MQLKILTISGYMCSCPCYKQENWGSYLISKEIAELVATKIPGFTIQVKVHLNHQCSSVFGPDGYKFEHIQPYARIWKTCLEAHEDQTGPLLIWNFQF
ncbi:unnamed protein product [Allacma fusca]|uniref:Uncharacterized protein n=1 Tax=Allacma fusca TaxID=39272 RepID=A0A8J2NSB5_9HEXA|nr:unnamed protein product [Allacma fusca]